jgi:hypothetical protein
MSYYDNNDMPVVTHTTVEFQPWNVLRVVPQKHVRESDTPRCELYVYLHGNKVFIVDDQYSFETGDGITKIWGNFGTIQFLSSLFENPSPSPHEENKK